MHLIWRIAYCSIVIDVHYVRQQKNPCCLRGIAAGIRLIGADKLTKQEVAVRLPRGLSGCDRQLVNRAEEM